MTGTRARRWIYGGLSSPSQTPRPSHSSIQCRSGQKVLGRRNGVRGPGKQANSPRPLAHTVSDPTTGSVSASFFLEGN